MILFSLNKSNIEVTPCVHSTPEVPSMPLLSYMEESDGSKTQLMRRAEAARLSPLRGAGLRHWSGTRAGKSQIVY